MAEETFIPVAEADETFTPIEEVEEFIPVAEAQPTDNIFTSAVKKSANLPSLSDFAMQQIADAVIKAEDEALPGKIATGLETGVSTVFSPFSYLTSKLPPEGQKVVGNVSNWIGLAANIIIDAQKQEVPSYGGEPFLQVHGAEPQKNMLVQSIVKEWKEGNSSLGDTIKKVAERNGIKPDSIIGGLTRLGALTTDLATTFLSLSPVMKVTPKIEISRGISKTDVGGIGAKGEQILAKAIPPEPKPIVKEAPKVETPVKETGTPVTKEIVPAQSEMVPGAKGEVLEPTVAKIETVEPKQVIEEIINKPVKTEIIKSGATEFDTLDPNIQKIVKEQANNVIENIKDINKAGIKPEDLYLEIVSQLKTRKPELFRAQNAKDLAIKVNEISEQTGFKLQPEEIVNLFDVMDKQNKANIDFGLTVKFEYPRTEIPVWYDPLMDKSLPRWVREYYAKDRGIPFKDVDKQMIDATNMGQEIGNPNFSYTDLSGKVDPWYAKSDWRSATLVSGQRILKGLGKEGAELEPRFINFMKIEDGIRGRYKTQLDKTGFLKLNEKQVANVFNVLLDKEKALTPELQKVADAMRPLLDAAHKEIVNAGIDVGYKKNYAMQYPDWKKIESDPQARVRTLDKIMKKDNVDLNNANKILEYLLNKNDPGRFAKSILNLAKGDYTKADAIIKNMESQLRFKKGSSIDFNLKYGFDDILKNKQVVVKYIDSMAERIAMEKHLKIDEVNPIIDKIAAKYGDVQANAVKRIYQQMNGTYEQPIKLSYSEEKFLKGMFRWNAYRTLAYAGINNIGQPFNTTLLMGLKNTMKGLHDTLTTKGWEGAKEAGMGVRFAMQEYLNNNGMDRYYKYTGLTPSERFIRTITWNAAEPWIKEVFAKAKSDMAKGVTDSKSIRMLRNFDLQDSLKQTELTSAQIDYVKYKAQHETMFSGNAMDTSALFDITTAKFITQFKSYSFAQGKLLNNYIWKEAQKKNFTPMLRALVYGQVAGEVVNDVRSLVKGTARQGQIDNVRRWLDNYGQAVMGIILWDFIDSTVQAKERGQSFKDVLSNTLLGSLIGTIGEGGGKVINAARGTKGSGEKLAKFAIQSTVPGAGQVLVGGKTNMFKPELGSVGANIKGKRTNK